MTLPPFTYIDLIGIPKDKVKHLMSVLISRYGLVRFHDCSFDTREDWLSVHRYILVGEDRVFVGSPSKSPFYYSKTVPWQTVLHTTPIL